MQSKQCERREVGGTNDMMSILAGSLVQAPFDSE